MNLSMDLTPTPLSSQETLSYEDIAPILRITSSEQCMFDDNEKTKKSDIIPGKNDILLGRDKEAHSHEGNKQFRKIVLKNRERYQSCRNRQEKTSVTAELIETIREYGGRFLKRNETAHEYEEVSNDVAHEKVSHALRSAKDPTKKQPRKKRKVVYVPPTPQENKAFEFLFQEQQKIFQQMLSERGDSEDIDMRAEAWSSEVVVGV